MASRSAFGREKNNTMPGASRTQQKAEARYNVTTQFPQYDLHFAAASGNLGLVEFALSHGQPINSVLNGVLPLHAACAGGSEVVVKYLIDEGADVNAPRIPRRYSNERHKSSGLAVGASGSTPLHFAAANGHLGVVKLLLAHGAVPDRADKHGVTPEMLARENGWVECAEVLKEWSGGREGDLPPVRDEESGSGPSIGKSANGNEVGNTNAPGSPIGNGTTNVEKDKEICEIAELIGSKRLQMKRSIDNALHLFKAPLLHHQSSQGQLRERGPPSPSVHSHSIFPLHPHPHLHSSTHSQSPSHGGSPPIQSHLHAIFHHGHSQSTSHLQGQSQSQSLAPGVSQSKSARDATGNAAPSPSHRPLPLPLTSTSSSSSLSPYFLSQATTATITASSNPYPYPNPLDGSLGVPGFIPGHRRPSLPQIFNEPASPFQRRLSNSGTGKKRRPRSAGEDAEPQSESQQNPSTIRGVSASGSSRGGGVYPSVNANTHTGATRKLSSKISLRNLFRRAGGEPSTTITSQGGSEPGSSVGSVSTTSSAPIYSLAFASSSNSSNPVNPGAGMGVRGRSSTSPTPPASPLSASFGASPSPAPAPVSGGGGRPGSWYRNRLASEGAGSVPVPRSPLVPSAVELHHRYSTDHLHEEYEGEAHPDSSENEVGERPQAQAPRLSARPSILRGHNRSSSSQSQSSSGTGIPGTPSGARTLRFEASASATSSAPSSTTGSASASPGLEPRPGRGIGTASAIRLRGTRSASSLRHEHSFGYDGEEEEEEEDYGTSINPPGDESGAAGMLGFEEDAELEETSTRVLPPPVVAEKYKYPTEPAGRARGASFTSTASSSPGISPSPQNINGDGRPYEGTEFPFSIDGPPLTPSSDATTPTSEESQSSVTTERKGEERLKGRRKSDAETSRVRGESFSSVETDESGQSRNDGNDGNASSSMSALTSITTPSPGTDLRVVLTDDNDTDVPRTIRSEAPINISGKSPANEGNAMYMHTSPTSSLDSLDVDPEAGDVDQPTSTKTKTHAPLTPLDLDLRGISNLAEAEALVRRAQQSILASASLPADGPESSGIPLSAQLAAYGEILALERRFARGEKQREMWGVRDDSDGEGENGGETKTKEKVDARKLQSAKEARMALTQKRRDALVRQRGATTGVVGGSSLRQKGVTKPPKHKRPHTAEGAPQASWGLTCTTASPSTDITSTSAGNTSKHLHSPSHSRSTSTPLVFSKDKESEKLVTPDIAIIETIATPIDSPKTPESAPGTKAKSNANVTDYPYTRYTIDDTRPSLPLRSRTPDPEALASASNSTDDFGVPLTRVATAPLQDSPGYGSGGSGSYGARGSSSVLRSDPTTRRTGAAHKLSKMGFSVDAHHHHHSHHSHSTSPGPHTRHVRSGFREREIREAFALSNSGSPASSAGSSRSPSKARFGGIKSLVRGLKGKT